ncbi:thioesterase family protein [Amycolatopsis sp. H20-H5]|nr:thioesterase family protein [Amycolatopsis sp. H20-H5]MEC3974193.1 thioesterase family protein [Amycolatopsis sp. H20-H5]
MDLTRLTASGLGPVNLETTVRFRRELTEPADLVVSCTFLWEPGRKTWRVTQELNTGEGTLIAEVESVSGLLDLTRRRLVDDPAEQWRVNATHPELLGLPPLGADWPRA